MKKVIYLLSFFLSANLFGQTTGWKQLPGPARGVIQQVETGIDNTVYVKNSSGLLYRKEASSKEWREIISPSSLSVSGVAFTLATDNSGNLYICAQLNSNGLAGIYRSRDKGNSWEQLLSGVSINFMTRSASGKLFAVRTSQNSTSLFLSRNDGAQWDSVDAFPFQALDFTVDKNDRCFFTLYSEEKTILEFDLASGLHKSLTPSPKTNSYYYSYITLAGDLPYIRYFDNGYIIKPDNTLELRSPLDAFNIQYNNNPLLSATDGTIYTLTSSSYYANDFKITYSTDFGYSWQQFTSVPSGVNSTEAQIALDSSGNFYLGTANGIYMTSDKGGFWRKIGLPVSNDLRLMEGPQNTILTIDGYTQYGISYGTMYLSEDEGASWGYPYLLPEGSQAYDRIISVDGEGGYFYFNYDALGNGINVWHSDSQTPLSFEFQSQVGAIPIQTAYFKDRFYALMVGSVLFTSDKGITWQALDIPITNKDPYSIGVDSSGTIYLGYAPSLYKSENNGISWTKISTDLKLSEITNIKFYGTQTIVMGTHSAGVWHSTDGGSNWERWDPYLHDSVNAIQFFRGRCYAATTEGMISCALGSNNWQNELFADEYIPVMQILNYEDKRLYASVANLGIWTSDSSLNAVYFDAGENKEGLTMLSDPYTRSNIAQFTLDKPQKIKLDLYNILGDRITSLASGFLEAGEHTIPIQTSSLTSGTYTVVLTGLRSSESARFLVSH
jgi:photosystem II stability/assembly factor-like uncharacterized protein